MEDDVVEIVEASLLEMLGADEEPSTQQLTLYIPNKDKNGHVIPKLQNWIKDGRKLLTILGGGATALPPADGSWLSPEYKIDSLSDLEDEGIIWEKTTVIYTYIKTDDFLNNLNLLRKFLHSFGRETNQGEVVFEFDGRFFRISRFDKI